MSQTTRRVLILCDDSKTTQLLVDHVRAPHLDLVTCSEVGEALRLIDRDRFDVVISNLELSRADAFDGMRRIRRVASRCPEAQVILVCGRIDQTVRDLGKALGATALIDKSAGLGPLRDLMTAGPATKSGHSSEDPRSKTGVEILDELLRDHSISAVLRPIVALTGKAGRRVHFGVEGLPHAPAGIPLLDLEVLLDHADRENRLFEFELQCIEAILVETCQLPSGGKVFVNVRPRTLALPEFAPAVKALARRHGHHESDLVIGPEGRRQMPNPVFVSTLRTVRDHGFGVVLSGHGPEHVDLLRSETLDYFRIDSGLTRGIPEERRSCARIRSIVEMASSVGVETIVAGVETEPELECVRRLGVDLVQGGYFSEPLSGRELNASFKPGLPESQAVASHPFESDAEHELSNFLTAIALMADQGMKKLTAEDPLYADLEQIRSAGERAVELSQEIRLSGLPGAPPS